MIPELGFFLLITAAVTSLAGGLSVLGGLLANREWLQRFWLAASPLSVAGFAGSLLCLGWSFISDDFSVLYVCNHSNSHLDPAYKVAAIWGSHEGSLLLWIFMMSAMASLAGLCRRACRKFLAAVEGVMLTIVGLFAVFSVFTSSPFLRVLPNVPVEGRDLNPVLQDIGLIIHPPVLFLGYASAALVFSIAMAAILSRTNSSRERDFFRKSVVAGWIFLTAGNALGSWWAYNELGWGGWWFWDPVENASFVPWLFCTALLHSLLQRGSEGCLPKHVLALATALFALCLLGTFIVRSGIVQSVHAFASDPGRGTGLLIISLVILVPAVWLVLADPSHDDVPQPVHGSLLVTSAVYLFVAAGLSVLAGTLYPILYEMLGLGRLTVGAPYFNSFFAPMACAAAFAIGVSNLLAGCGRMLVPWIISFVSAGLAAAASLFIVQPKDPLMASMGTASAAWIIASFLVSRKGAWGVALAHIGVAVSIIGATGISNWESEALVRMGPGLGKPVADVIFVCEEIRPVKTHSYFADEARISVLDAVTEEVVAVLRPQRQTFRANGAEMTAAGIRHGFLRDFYVSVGNRLSEDEYLMRLTVKPLAGWIWSGAFLMVIGAALSFVRRNGGTAT